MQPDSFEKISGKENVSKNANTLLAYSTDASPEKGDAAIVVWPKTMQETQKLIVLAKQKLADVVVRGGGTGLSGGAVPKHSIVLNMSKMNGILEITDKTVTVEAGINLDDLNAVLESKGLWFPVEPSSHAVCTIGGMIACNAAGKRAVKYGKMRDWVKYLEVVDGTGAIRRVNDVDKFCGTEGTLGVIANAELLVTRKPVKTSLDVYKFDKAMEAANKIALLKKKPQLLSLEILDPQTSALLKLERRYHLIAEYDSLAAEIKDEYRIKEWNNLRDAAYTVTASSGCPIIQDPEVKDEEKLASLMQYLETMRIPFFGHAGIGVLHPCFEKSSDLTDFFKTVQSLGGKVTGEHGIGLAKKKYAEKSLQDKILFYKKSYDPYNIMNRGKIV